jgi:hypothetical protein
MPKPDYPTPDRTSTSTTTNPTQELVTSLTNAFKSVTRDEPPPPDQRAVLAAAQYADLKAALRTHAESASSVSTLSTRQG